jgi:uncharacterized membrane protein
VFTGKLVDRDTLQSYQRLQPDKSWDDTLQALRGNAEHTPLYFLMARGWAEWFGESSTAMRMLPALFGVLILPAVWWLGWELFESTATAWMAAGLVAIAPIHVLYAQEARPYSLWTLAIVLSSAVLLWAMRMQKRASWIAYGVTVAIGLYTQLLFGLVVMAHALYVVLLDRVNQQRSPVRQLSRTIVAYLLTTAGAFVAFLPWLIVVITSYEQIKSSTSTLTKAEVFWSLLKEWLVTFGRLFLDRDLKDFNWLLAIFTGFALYYLCRHAPKRAWLFVLTLVGVCFLTLAIPDLIAGGQRSSRLRYLFPCYIGIQLAVAYLLVSLAVWAKTWKQKLWRVVLLVLVVGGISGNVIHSQAEVWWNKSLSRTGYYPAALQAMNQSDRPLLISDGPEVDVVAFSYRLKPEVKFQLISDLQISPNLNRFAIAPGFNSIFLLNPSENLRNWMKVQNYSVQPVPGTRSKSRRVKHNLWRCQKQA